MKIYVSGFMCLVAGICLAQTKIDLRDQGTTADFSGFPHTRPAQTGTSLPSSCQPGELFFNTSAPVGQNLYACTGNPATWNIVGANSAATMNAAVGGSLIVADTGSANAYAGCPTPAVGLTDGVLISLRTVNTNSGPSTFNLCASGPRAIVSQAGGALSAGAIAAAAAGAPAGPLLMYNASTGTYALLTPGSVVPYSGATQGVDLGANSLHAAVISTGDGTVSPALILPELTANGTNDTRIYGADSQASSGCIIWPVGMSATGQAAMDSGSTAVTSDGETCRVFTWQTPSGGSGGGGGAAVHSEWFPLAGALANNTVQVPDSGAAVAYGASGPSFGAVYGLAGNSLGVLQFPPKGASCGNCGGASAEQDAWLSYILPSTWTGSVTIVLEAVSTLFHGGGGNVQAKLYTACVPVGGDLSSPAYALQGAQAVSNPAAGYSRYNATWSNLSLSSCHPGDMLSIKIGRDLSSSADTSPDFWALYGMRIVVTY